VHQLAIKVYWAPSNIENFDAGSLFRHNRVTELPMVERKLGIWIGVLVALMVLIVTWALLQHPANAPALVTINASAKDQLSSAPSATPVTHASNAAKPSSLWVRPPATIAARHHRRGGFGWILKQLGANERLLDRLADEDVVAVLIELKALAAAGDPAAINILGQIAYRACYLGRNAEVLDGYEASQVAIAKELPPVDADWVDAALHEDIAYDKRVKAACDEVISVDQVLDWVEGRAKQGDGASLWLLSTSTGNLAEQQRLLREAAATGFAEAQYELAWIIVAGQQGAAGSGADEANLADLLRQSAEPLATAETELAVCEYHGCNGLPTDVYSAVAHAREAARRGSIDGILEIGPHLPASQIDSDEVAAWNLVHASLEQRGCGGNGFSVQWMKTTTAVLNSNVVTPHARTLADQFWSDYSEQIMTNLGCGP
jgi:hypothetical protein